jgi:DNA-binding transcriptional MerR regulator
MTSHDDDQLLIAEIGPPEPPPTREPRPRPVRRARRTAAGEGVDLGSDKLYFKIGEVAQIVGVPAYVLRYWETEFKILKPQKSRAQQRVYRRRDVETLLKIKHLLYAKKFTIAGARQQLRLASDEVEMAPPASGYLATQSLSAVREALADLLACVSAEPDHGSVAADPAAYIRAMGGARALVDQSTSPQPLLERPAREAL